MASISDTMIYFDLSSEEWDAIPLSAQIKLRQYVPPSMRADQMTARQLRAELRCIYGLTFDRQTGLVALRDWLRDERAALAKAKA